MANDLQQTTVALALPDNTAFDEWLDTGRDLASQKRHLDWLIGDWVAFGRAHYPEQIELALEVVTDDPRQIKRAERTALAFPPHLRDTSLTFDHHAHVADMPVQEALPLLKAAKEEGLSAKQFRFHAMLHKIDAGTILPREDDPADDQLLALCRLWNRSDKNVRAEFAEMVADSKLGIIEP